jgi:hypothetical protein
MRNYTETTKGKPAKPIMATNVAIHTFPACHVAMASVCRGRLAGTRRGVKEGKQQGRLHSEAKRLCCLLVRINRIYLSWGPLHPEIFMKIANRIKHLRKMA